MRVLGRILGCGLLVLLAGCGGTQVRLSPEFQKAIDKGTIADMNHAARSRGEKRVAAELTQLAERDREFDYLKAQGDYANLLVERSNQQLALRNDDLEIEIARDSGKSYDRLLKREALDRQRLSSTEQAISLYESAEVPARGASAVLAEMAAAGNGLDACRAAIGQMLRDGIYTLRSERCRNVSWND